MIESGPGTAGLSTGQGIYDWARRDGAALVRERVEELFRYLRSRGDN